MNAVRCPLCLEPDAAMLRLDKHGRPYLRCRWCESRTFIGNSAGLTTVLLAQPALTRLVEANGGARALQAQADSAFAASALPVPTVAGGSK